jgi:O-antigen/teichoic acid export membrane protein
LGLAAYAWFFEGTGTSAFSGLLVAGTVLLLRPFDVIDFWFQSFVQARYSAMARLAGIIAGSSLKIMLVVTGFGLVELLLAHVMQSLLAVMLLLVFYIKHSKLPLSSWRFSRERASSLLSEGWLVYLGSIFAMIYLKIDQVMLRWLQGTQEVGYYAIAAQISEAWYFIPTAIVASLFPKLIQIRERSKTQFDHRLQQLLDILFNLGVVVAIAVTALAPWIISLFAGEAYRQSAPILVIHIWAAVFMFMRVAFSRWILIEGLLMFSLLTQGGGALFNIVLNFILIPKLGGIGAAYATLLSYAVASFFSLAIYPKTRPVFLMMVKSAFALIRYTPYAAKQCAAWLKK